ncbi:CHASE2 domain-containing protein [Advenella mimigardefordensis]|uniref:histidine kinase n=1 Tax=Advenella mimigardefordensis (strain DSM 17166 / LMG 22922 / DPN7) TaxID=1247726 RepID=W0PJ64_ADVMD|nr:CHASE2 domain-containing protein [Advenella mimigardefordensis]AHG66062.1 putative signal transduction histidine kinase [Advenella mimigardefordensis DPN7]
MLGSLGRRFHREWLLVTLVILAVTALGSQFSILSRFSYALYDVAVSYTQSRQPDPDIAIIVIDDKSLTQIGFWPWERKVHAELVNILHNARAIGFDILFTDADPHDTRTDQQLAQAIADNGNVVLANFLSDPGQQVAVNPIAKLARAARALGFINIVPDTDGMVRRIRLTTPQDTTRQHFALSMLAAGGDSAAVASYSSRSKEEPYLIPYVGTPQTFPMISYSDVLFGRIPARYFDNKYVLIGAWGTGMGDRFPTPASAGIVDNMSGVEILANVLQSAREGNWNVIPGTTTHMLISLAPVLVLLIAIRQLSPRRVLFATLVVLLLVLAGSVLLLALGNMWVSPVAAMIGVALTYPVWSWRTQELALNQMGREMSELNREYPLLRAEMALADAPQKFHLSLNERIMQLRFALNRVRSLRQFISDSFNAIPDPALVFDASHQLTLWTSSAERYMARLDKLTLSEGLPLQSLLNAIIADATTSRELVTAIEHHERTAAEQSDESSSAATGIHSEDGFEVRDRAGNDLLLKSMPTYTAGQRRSGYILNLIDISALREAERKRDETLRFISHDMRAPQNSILALIDLQTDDTRALPTDELLRRVSHLSGRTISLVEDFVQFTRAEKADIEFVPLNLSDLLQDAINEVWIESRARHIPIVSHISPLCAFIRGDQSLLMRCLSNLLDNAFKYSPDNTTITCTLASAGDFWEVSIRDQGCGISQQDQQHLFTLYTRVGTSNEQDPGGLGLGLVFVKTVVMRHHGEVRVQSAPGQGSTFIIRLPKDETEESAGPSL